MRRLAAAVLVSGVLAAGGCAPGQKADRAVFNAGYAAFEARDWQQAVERFGEYLRGDPSSPHRAEVYYYRGEALVHLGRRAEARSDFLRSLGAGPRPPIDQFVRVALGNLYYEEGNDRAALEQYAQVLKDPHKAAPMPMVLLRTGVSLQRLGKWEMAEKYLGHLVAEYPDAPASGHARLRLGATAFAVQTGAYASRVIASQQAERVRAAGFAPRLEQVARGGQTLCTVQVGRAATYAEAAALAQRVRQAGFETLIVP